MCYKHVELLGSKKLMDHVSMLCCTNISGNDKCNDENIESFNRNIECHYTVLERITVGLNAADTIDNDEDEPEIQQLRM